MTKTCPESDDLAHALRRLAGRAYGVEGIPMLLVLENRGHEVMGLAEDGPDLGGVLHDAATLQVHEPGPAGTARLVEWLADATFGPSALETLEAGESDG
ncbi:MAG: hypothetical protein ABW026_06275 [Microvirga sp.]